jgi:hypothetical protein
VSCHSIKRGNVTCDKTSQYPIRRTCSPEQTYRDMTAAASNGRQQYHDPGYLVNAPVEKGQELINSRSVGGRSQPLSLRGCIRHADHQSQVPSQDQTMRCGRPRGRTRQKPKRLTRPMTTTAIMQWTTGSIMTTDDWRGWQRSGLVLDVGCAIRHWILPSSSIAGSIRESGFFLHERTVRVRNVKVTIVIVQGSRVLSVPSWKCHRDDGS